MTTNKTPSLKLMLLHLLLLVINTILACRAIWSSGNPISYWFSAISALGSLGYLWFSVIQLFTRIDDLEEKVQTVEAFE